MFNFKSVENYDSLKKFFLSQHAEIRKILISNFLTEQDFQIIKKELKEMFCDDFFACLAVGRAMFLPQNLLNALFKLFKELELTYEEPICEIITSHALPQQDKDQISQDLSHHHGSMRFVYSVNHDIVAGMVFKIKNQYFDGSFKSILLNMKKEIQNEYL